MSVTFYKELNSLSRARKIISMLPRRVRMRVAKSLYNYESAAIQGIDIVVPLQDDGLVCFVNTKDVIGWQIYFTGEYEAGTNRVLEKYVKKGNIVIEAGSNIGSETVLLSRLAGADGMVYGFEPNPYVFERLKINVTINELPNVQVFDIAIGEHDTNVSFHIFPKGFCNSGMASKYMDTPITKKIDVVQKTLDTFMSEQQVAKVDFLKMDIQGAEMDMLVGARATIARHKPTIFMEAQESCNDVTALYKELDSYGYAIHKIEENSTTHMKSLSEVKEGNWLAIYKK